MCAIPYQTSVEAAGSHIGSVTRLTNVRSMCVNFGVKQERCGIGPDGSRCVI
jgi:hypothetical protein